MVRGERRKERLRSFSILGPDGEASRARLGWARPGAVWGEHLVRLAASVLTGGAATVRVSSASFVRENAFCFLDSVDALLRRCRIDSSWISQTCHEPLCLDSLVSSCQMRLRHNSPMAKVRHGAIPVSNSGVSPRHACGLNQGQRADTPKTRRLLFLLISLYCVLTKIAVRGSLLI